ncbi:MAG: Flp pilus assembly complex ATPase component TadA [Armatimonadetes bacterium]|nr:Flp pilus assembly complex ATPase component TadA [Armatimonadota bacterium]
MKRVRIGDLLVENGLVTPDDVTRALEVQKETREPLGAIFLRLGLVSETDLLEALSELLQIPVWDLQGCPPTAEALECVPQNVCQQFKAVPVHCLGDDLYVAMANVDDVAASDAMAQIAKKRIKPVLVRKSQLDTYLGTVAPEALGQVDDLVSRALEIAADHSVEDDDESILTIEGTAPVISLVNQIIAQAIVLKASDIHIEPRRDRVDVRYRIDGLMHEAQNFPPKLHPMVVARIKIMGELDIVENRLPQDGHLTAKLENRSVDIRVSLLPNRHGSRVVMRIMDSSAMSLSLEDLGFSDVNLNTWRGLIDNPYGLLLVTGPTGSGKTTTLYSAMKTIAGPTRNIMTCEDPIECDLDGVNQSQVNERIGLTFARQLRAILRQDPDVVLVGEIRDAETLQTAIRASMTGHLVLSTLHCNDAIGALPRIFDMGAEPYLLSTSLLGVVAQRLVRKLCPNCREEAPVSAEDAALIQHYLGQSPSHLWSAKGCQACAGIGFKGRTGVHEIFRITQGVASHIARRATIEEITAQARRDGMVTIQEDALNKVLSGVTSIAEARRLVAFNDCVTGQTVLRAA